jgi:hypothetical protein
VAATLVLLQESPAEHHAARQFQQVVLCVERELRESAAMEEQQGWVLACQRDDRATTSALMRRNDDNLWR